MFFVTRWNLKIVISILILTFYIINQISIINIYIFIVIALDEASILVAVQFSM